MGIHVSRDKPSSLVSRGGSVGVVPVFSAMMYDVSVIEKVGVLSARHVSVSCVRNVVGPFRSILRPVSPLPSSGKPLPSCKLLHVPLVLVGNSRRIGAVGATER
jgi:hypothetical protein